MVQVKIKCHDCGNEQMITLPKQGVLPFYVCKGCKGVIPTPKGAHCVICAYADQKCH